MRNLIPDYIAEKFAQNQNTGNFSAITMFLDISGFTSMTERLMQEGKEGAEVLSHIINNIFAPVIEMVYSMGGFISTFAGDAFTAIFPDTETPVPIVTCAVEINRIFQEICKQQTRFGEFELFVKLGLSVGIVDFGIIGSEEHKTFFFRGEAIDGCAHSEHRCDKMEIILDQRILDLLPKNQIETRLIDSDYYKLIKCDAQETIPTNPILVKQDKQPITQDILQKFMPEQVLNLNQQGEFREIVSVFISFKEPENYQKLNDSITEIINQCHKQGGYFNKIDFGDKGGVILVLFGAPVGYENNVIRALNFISNIRLTLNENIRAGITTGIAYSGFVGSLQRCEYTALGDIVNQSARFMMKADWGDILISETIAKKVSKVYQIDDLGKMTFKGKSEPVAVFRLHKKAENQENAFFSGEMVGRQIELTQLMQNAQPLADGKFANVSIVYGEAGMGKSRLVYEFIKSFTNPVKMIFMQTDSILRMSMNPFKYYLNNYFDQTNAQNKDDKKRHFEAVYYLLLDNLRKLSDERKIPIISEIERTKSILAAQVDVHYENSLYDTLDPKGRYENTLFAYKDFFKALSLLQPIIIQVEDIHWLDEDSQKVFQTLCRAISDFSIMIVATSRFNDDGTKPNLKVDKEIIQQEIVLDKLEESTATAFIELQLNGQADEVVLKLINSKAEHNPFYIEQIIHYLKENNLLVRENGKFIISKQSIQIPASVNAIIIARIDRLENELKNIIQVASVLGREVELKLFLVMLELYKSVLDKDQIEPLLDKIEDEQLWKKFTEIKYIFKHALLHEAVYEMQLKNRLRELHDLAAQSIEKIYAGDEEKYYEIAYHYDKAENITQAVNYYEKAGNWFKKNYKNLQAIECYDKLLGYLDEEKDTVRVIKILGNKGKILELIGKWNESEILYQKAVDLATKIGDKQLFSISNCYLGSLLQDKGCNEEAMKLFEKAKLTTEAIGDKQLYSMAVGNIGLMYSDKSDYDNAILHFDESKQICIELGDKKGYSASVNNLGTVYLDKGDYDKAMLCFEERKQICIELGDKRGYSGAVGNMGIAYKYKGNYGMAMQCYMERKQICLDLGDKRGCSMILCNIGLAYNEKGDYDKAMQCFLEDKHICLELGYKDGYSRAVGNMGLVYKNRGDYDRALLCIELRKQTCLALENKAGYSIAVCNMGNVHWNKGDHDNAMLCYEEAKKIYLEIGDRRGYSIAMDNLGAVYKKKGDYNKAVQCYEKAICIGKEMQIKDYLCDYLYNKADLLFTLKNYASAQTTNEEANQIAREVERQDTIFSSTILSYKLLALDNPAEAISNLTLMHETETEAENLATIHYEIYKINQSAEHSQKALELYQELYTKTPKFDYKNKIDELAGVVPA